MPPPPATMVSRPPIIDHNSYISFRDFVPDEDAANLTRASEGPSAGTASVATPGAGNLWIGRQDQTAFILAQREALESYNVAKAMRQSEESARADEARRARAAAAVDSANTFASTIVVEAEAEVDDAKEHSGSCTQSQALAIRTMTPAPTGESRAIARSRQINAMQYSLLEKTSSGSLGSAFIPSSSPSSYIDGVSGSPPTSYPISESPTRTRFTSASASAAAHEARKATALGMMLPPGSASASASGIRRPSSSASTQAQAHARRPSITTMVSSPATTFPTASVPIPVPNSHRAQTPASLSYQQMRQSQVYQDQPYHRSRLNSQSLNQPPQPSPQNRPMSPPQPQQPYQQFIPQHARNFSQPSSIRSSTPLSSSYTSSSASAFASSHATSYSSNTTLAQGAISSSPKFNVPVQPPAGHSSASASAAGYTRARAFSRSEVPQRPATAMAPVAAYAPSTSPTVYTTAAMVSEHERRRKTSVSHASTTAANAQPQSLLHMQLQAQAQAQASATPAAAPPQQPTRDGVTVGARLARPSTSLGHSQHQRSHSQSQPPVPVPPMPRQQPSQAQMQMQPAVVSRGARSSSISQALAPEQLDAAGGGRDRPDTKERDAREMRERQLAKEEARDAGADLFTPTRPCAGCGRPVASPRSQGSPEVDLPVPFADLLHVTCSACRTTHCRGCFSIAWCKPAPASSCTGGSGCCVVNCCTAVRVIAVFEALAAFDSIYIQESASFATTASLSASQTTRDGDAKKSHTSVGRQQRQAFLRALVAKPRTSRFSSALLRTLAVLREQLLPPAADSDAADQASAYYARTLQRVLARSLLPEVLYVFLADAPVREWVAHSETCMAMLDVLSRMCEACPGLLTQRLRAIERTPGVGRVVWARGRVSWASMSSADQAGAGVAGDMTLRDIIRGLEAKVAPLRALAGNMHYAATIDKVNNMCDRMSYLLLQQLLGIM